MTKKQNYKIFSIRLTEEDNNKLEFLKNQNPYSTKISIIASLINQAYNKINKNIKNDE